MSGTSTTSATWPRCDDTYSRLRMPVAASSSSSSSASLDVRLERNRTEYRLAEKKSKRDVDWSDANVREMEQYLMSTDRPTVADDVLSAYPHLRIDNTDRSPEDVAAQVLTWLDTV